MTGLRPRVGVTPRWWPRAARLAGALSVLTVTGLWWHNENRTPGQLAGLLAADLLLLQVLLMARVPLVERSFGQDTLARWHRWTGFASFLLLLAHILLATLTYAAAVLSYPGVLLATAGTAALVLVVVTSVRRARRRLRYERWHLLHLYAYAGIGLALPHLLWTEPDPVARAYWQGLCLLAAGSVLVFRIAVPLGRTLRHRLVVDEVVPEAHGLVSVHFRGRELDRLPVRAGQFFVWRFLDGHGWSRGNPFSLSGPPHGDRLRITVKSLGDGSARVTRLTPGTRVLIEGPYGRLTAESYRGGPVTMLACGVGITPLLALLWDLPYGHNQATLLYRARHAHEVAFLDEIEWLAGRRGVRLVPLIGPRARPGSWLPAEYAGYSDAAALRELAPDIAGHDLYVCGPDAWTDTVRTAARAAGVPAARIHRERFSW
ncbi:ferredoxin reductase family protein [Symbioplanes lichenis]|uniref:ferredoxin reductase family protein n=1 Tax=Symbioplanes lichenis TaxID=1629072 RepID=UPI00273A4F5E|nr:ferric reductase-like transmembrane domain-containing protein [Actinoplanes lichenis]